MIACSGLLFAAVYAGSNTTVTEELQIFDVYQEKGA